MPISNGDQMPEGSLKVMTDSGIKDMSTADLFNGRIVTLFSLLGAFTPTCSNKYLPSYLENYGAKGVQHRRLHGRQRCFRDGCLG
jgi:peroxiredoxin